jgi:hypothetical protein
VKPLLGRYASEQPPFATALSPVWCLTDAVNRNHKCEIKRIACEAEQRPARELSKSNAILEVA